MIRKIAYFGLLISGLWLIFPILPQNLDETRTSISTLSTSSFDIEKRTLEKIEVEKAVSISSSSDTVSEISEDDNYVVDQIALMEQAQNRNADVIINQNDRAKKITIVENFLSRWSGPAKYYAGDFVDTADRYGLDYRLLPSISVVESGACKHTFKPYNCFGWGRMTFESYPDAIDTVGYGIAKNYYAKGRVTPAQIAPVYAPPSTTWAANVTNLMAQMPKL